MIKNTTLRKETRGRKKGSTYSRNKDTFSLYIMGGPKHELWLGNFPTYLKIGEFLGLPRTTVKSIATGKTTKKYGNIRIEKLKD